MIWLTNNLLEHSVILDDTTLKIEILKSGTDQTYKLLLKLLNDIDKELKDDDTSKLQPKLNTVFIWGFSALSELMNLKRDFCNKIDSNPNASEEDKKLRDSLFDPYKDFLKYLGDFSSVI